MDDGPDPAAQSGKPDFAELVTLAPRQTLDVPVPVKAGRTMGVTLLAAPDVSANLIDDRGGTAGASLTKTPSAHQPFRSIRVERPVVGGDWTLRLENGGESEREVLIASRSEPN